MEKTEKELEQEKLKIEGLQTKLDDTLAVLKQSLLTAGQDRDTCKELETKLAEMEKNLAEMEKTLKGKHSLLESVQKEKLERDDSFKKLEKGKTDLMAQLAIESKKIKGLEDELKLYSRVANFFRSA